MSKELETLKARIDEYGAQRELVGAYSALKADAWMDAESHAETQREGIDKLLELLKPENQEAIEKVKETWPRITQVINQFSGPVTEPEEPSGRRGTLVTDLSQLSKGDVVDCYWNDGGTEADLTVDRDPTELTAGGYAGFAGRMYWWDPTRHANQEVRLVEKAEPGRLTDVGLLPTTKGSQIMVYEISTRYGSPRRFIDGVAYEHDGDYLSEWVRQGPAHQGKAEILLDRKRLLEFEVTYDAGKENA